MKVKFLTIALTLTTMVACQNTHDKTPASSGEGQKTSEKPPAESPAAQKANDKNPAVLGKWRGREWIFMGKPSGMDATQVNFEFKEDGTFKANFAEQQKSGTWRTMKDSLFTMEPGKKEVPIRLLKADGTALDFEMDIKGNKEIIRFKKQ
ncbi:MAG: hypothetical protein H7246_04115 [Phycisphaerae bacterium]|nr:hypothetical protein [Saprospiraceae bacterium]